MQTQHLPRIGIFGVATAAYREPAFCHRATAASLLHNLQGEAVDAFLARLDMCASGEAAFTLVLDDPAGNSYVEVGAGADAALALERYERTPEQACGTALGCRQGLLVCGGTKALLWLCCSAA